MFRKELAFVLSSLCLASACGATIEEELNEIATEEDALTTTSDSYVALRRDTRRCVAPMCGGFWARDLNKTTAEQYVSGLDFANSGLDQSVVDGALAAADELVVKGRLGPREPQFRTRTLVVAAAYRGLPGVVAANNADFYEVGVNNPPITCITAPCNNVFATLLNRNRGQVSLTGVNVAPASKSFVDQQWLTNRVETRGALVAGVVGRGARMPGGYETILDVSQVYLKLPEAIGSCPQFQPAHCAQGEVDAYHRNEERCIVPSGCVPAAFCPQYFPSCDEGYTLASWTSESGCDAFACDPTFTTQDQNVPTSCAAVLCGPDTVCVEGPNGASCEPILTCASVLCAPDTHCVDANGSATCVPDVWARESANIGTANPYANNVRRSWTFTSNEPNATATRLHFSRFDLEEGYDFVIIETLSGEELARYTGPLGAFTTDVFAASTLRIRFISDHSVVRSGFGIDHIESRTH